MQKPRHVMRLARRQAGGRFIQQQNPGIAGESKRDFKLALLAMRERSDLDPATVLEPRLLEQLTGLVVHVSARG